MQGLTKRYGEVLAVDDLSFAVLAGTTTALLGANGAGKTTTLRAICNTVRTTGEIEFDAHAPPRRPRLTPENPSSCGLFAYC